jgi:MFS family permease
MPEPAPSAPRNLLAFGFTALLNDTATEMAYWVLPAFLTSIGVGPAQLGIIEGIAESVASLAKLFSGYLADKIHHRKPVVVAGYFVANAVKPALAFVSAWWQVLAVRFADRFSKGIRGTTRDVMLADSVEKGKIGGAYGLLQAMDSAGAIAGPLIALFLLRHFSLRGVFLLAGVPGVLCVAVAWLGIREVQQRDRLQSESSRARTAGSHLPRRCYFLLIVVTFFSLGNSSDMFLVLRAQNIGIPGIHAPLLGLVFNTTYTLFSWPAGHLSDRFSRPTIAAAGYLVFAATYFVFGLAPSILAIWCMMSFYGLFYALTEPVLKALLVEVVVPDMRGRALGLYAFTTSLAMLLASLITGELWQHYGPRAPFYLSAGIAVVAAFMLLISRATPSGKRKPTEA